MKIVCFGDSLTYGFGVAKELTWTKQLENSLKVQLINKGVNGDTTAGMLSRSYNDIVSNKPNIAIIMGGTNDLFMNRNYDYVFENMREILDECLKYKIIPITGIQMKVFSKKAKIYWDAFIDYNDVNQNIIKFRELIVNYCINKKINYIDFFKLFNDIDYKHVHEYYLDGLHPDIKGHNIMFKKAVEVIKMTYGGKNETTSR